MAKISMNEVVDATLLGIEKSYFEYKCWSADEWLWRAPEYFLTVNIAKEIWNLNGPKYITLEDNIKDTLHSAESKIKGRLSQYMRSNGRADIILWWGNKGTPRAIIEVKHRVYKFTNIQEDLDRIIEVLKKESHLQFSITTFYMDKNYKTGNVFEKLERQILNIFEQSKEYLAIYSKNLIPIIYYNIHPEDNQNVWASVVILIKKKSLIK